MNSFRSPRDEHMEIENRWRLLLEREANLSRRERDVRVKEEDIRRFIRSNSITSMQPVMPQMPQMPPIRHSPPYTHSKKSRKKSFNNNDKDYSRFAVKPDTEIHKHESP
jgi:hypothetical protein